MTKPNKLVCQGTKFSSWHGYDALGRYVGRIEKDQYGAWHLYDSKGRHLPMHSFHDARDELRNHCHV